MKMLYTGSVQMEVVQAVLELLILLPQPCGYCSTNPVLL